MTTILVGALILTTAMMAIFAAFAKRRLRHLRHYSSFSEQFYRSVAPLVSDERTPEAVLRMVGFLSRKINDRRAARDLLFVMYARKEDPSTERSERAHLDIEKFLRDVPDLNGAFHGMCSSALIAISYNSLVVGDLLRLILRGTPVPNPTEQIKLAEKYKQARADEDDRTPPREAMAA